MQVTGSDAVRIAFETMGGGLPLVLSHGLFGDRTTWRSAGYVDALADSHRLGLIDARGQGGSDAPHDAESYRIDHQVDDVIAVLDELNISRWRSGEHRWAASSALELLTECSNSPWNTGA
ncbi:alpha/beta fold hydrolase [Streptomyces sp. NPDC086549]|uniref:alpha/beta fold hydrolase n=1 Tax=Streptomyces sp. NPDC086549 TaxID=3365752 RepID=UPI0038190506